MALKLWNHNIKSYKQGVTGKQIQYYQQTEPNRTCMSPSTEIVFISTTHDPKCNDWNLCSVTGSYS